MINCFFLNRWLRKKNHDAWHRRGLERQKYGMLSSAKRLHKPLTPLQLANFYRLLTYHIYWHALTDMSYHVIDGRKPLCGGSQPKLNAGVSWPVWTLYIVVLRSGPSTNHIAPTLTSCFRILRQVMEGDNAGAASIQDNSCSCPVIRC